MRTLLTNIGELTTNDSTGDLHDAAVLIDHGRIEWVGAAADAPSDPEGYEELRDPEDRIQVTVGTHSSRYLGLPIFVL